MVGARVSGQNRQRFGQCTAFVAHTRTDTAMQLREHNSPDNYLQQINSLDNIPPIPPSNNALRASVPLVSTASLAQPPDIYALAVASSTWRMDAPSSFLRDNRAI